MWLYVQSLNVSYCLYLIYSIIIHPQQLLNKINIFYQKLLKREQTEQSVSTVSHWLTGGALAPSALMHYSVNRKSTEALSELKWTRQRNESSVKSHCERRNYQVPLPLVHFNGTEFSSSKMDYIRKHPKKDRKQERKKINRGKGKGECE